MRAELSSGLVEGGERTREKVARIILYYGAHVIPD